MCNHKHVYHQKSIHFISNNCLHDRPGLPPRAQLRGEAKRFPKAPCNLEEPAPEVAVLGEGRVHWCIYAVNKFMCIYIYIFFVYEHMKYVWKHVFQIMKANTFQRKRTCASYWFIHFNISFWTYSWSSSSIFKKSIKILKVKDWAKFQTSSLWIHWNHQRDCRNTTCFRNKTPLWVGMSES